MNPPPKWSYRHPSPQPALCSAPSLHRTQSFMHATQSTNWTASSAHKFLGVFFFLSNYYHISTLGMCHNNLRIAVFVPLETSSVHFSASLFSGMGIWSLLNPQQEHLIDITSAAPPFLLLSLPWTRHSSARHTVVNLKGTLDFLKGLKAGMRAIWSGKGFL